MVMTHEPDIEQPVGNFINIARAVELTGYSDQYLRRLARRGAFHAIKFYHVWMVDSDSLHDYLNRANHLSEGDKRHGPRDPP